MISSRSSRVSHIIVRASFLALTISVVFTIVGMILLYHFPVVVGRFGMLLPWFMQVPTWVYMAAMPLIVFLLSVEHVGWRISLALCLWGSGVGLVAELIGTSTGLPFGEYGYTDFLAPKFLGLVPVLIPLSWYTTAVLAYELAAATHLSRGPRILIGAAYMVCWDIALDPAMAYGFPVWEWGVDGFFYGMPVLNLIGWFMTSLVIMWGFDARLSGFRITAGRWLAPVWIVGALLPLGISALRGMWLALAVGAIAVTVPLWVASRPRSSRFHTKVNRMAA